MKRLIRILSHSRFHRGAAFLLALAACLAWPADRSLASVTIAPLHLDTWTETGGVWSHPDWTVSSSGGALYGVVDTDGVKTFYAQRLDSTTQRGRHLIWNGTLGGVEYVSDGGYMTEDYSGSVILRNSSRYAGFGIVIGAKNHTYGSTSGYGEGQVGSQGFYAVTQPQEAGMGILFNPGTNAPLTMNEAAMINGTWTPYSRARLMGTYLMEFSVAIREDVADTLSVVLWELDGNDAKVGGALAETSYTAAEGESFAGYFAMRAGAYGGNYTIHFRDLELTVIPEPGTLALLGVAGAALWWRRRR